MDERIQLNCYQCKHKHTDRPTDWTVKAEREREGREKKGTCMERAQREKKNKHGRCGVWKNMGKTIGI